MPKTAASLREYSFALIAVIAATAICFAMFPRFELTNLVMVYLLGTLAVAARGHRGPAALSSVLSVLAFDFYFVPPRFTFTVADAQYVWTFAVMFTAAMIISHLTVRIRSEAEAARAGERRTAMMHELTQQLAASPNLERTLLVGVRHVSQMFEAHATVFLPKNERLIERASAGGASDVGEKESAAAQWVFDNRQAAGIGTSVLPGERALYVPLQGAEGPVGVLRVRLLTPERTLDATQRQVLESFAHQIGLALEVDRLQENAQNAQMDVEKERLRSSLLSSVSHDFRTPLAAILGSASALLGSEDIPKSGPARELLENIQEETERLSSLVQNLLEVTRLESGAVNLRKELYPLEEVVGSALERVEKRLGRRQVVVQIPDDLPLIPMDPVLMEQVFINLLENAARHTPDSSSIEINARQQGNRVSIEIADNGPGLKPEELRRAFEKFYKGPTSAGAGLGLAISRAVVNAHQGNIGAENRPAGGAIFRFTLPLS